MIKRMDYFFATVPATVPIFRNRSQNNLQFFCCFHR